MTHIGCHGAYRGNDSANCYQRVDREYVRNQAITRIMNQNKVCW